MRGLNKIITKPKELEGNQQVLYAGNHYISVPEIEYGTGVVRNINLVSLSNKALVELDGENGLFLPLFFKRDLIRDRELIWKNNRLGAHDYFDMGNQFDDMTRDNINGFDNQGFAEIKSLQIERVEVEKEGFYIPCSTYYLEDGTVVRARIYADLKEKGLIYDFESSEELDILLICDVGKLNLLRFNSYQVEMQKRLHIDKWLGNPVLTITANGFSLGMAFGGDRDFSFIEASTGELILQIACKERNCFYISINSDPDGASTTLIHLRRKYFLDIYRELLNWLECKTVRYEQDLILERRLNENLFFNYFFALAKDLESDRFVGLTSRSPRYYVSGAFWERDTFLWSMPAIQLVAEPCKYREILRELILTHSKNPGDHAHYIDGTVLYPGFELDQAASYFIVTAGMEENFFDDVMLKALAKVYERIEGEFDVQTGLYKTFLLPSDDPTDYPFVTIDNVLLWKGLMNYRDILLLKGKKDEIPQLEEKIQGIRRGIYQYLVRNVEEKEMFVWSSNGNGDYCLYNDPPGNLGLLHYYGFVEKDDPIYVNTINYYYSSSYQYYFTDAKYRELACDHHPNTPSGLGLCGTILNPLKTAETLAWVKELIMDHGLLCESFDCNTGEGKTGVGFGTGAGYLALALSKVLFDEVTK